MVGLYYSASILAGRASDPFVVPPSVRKDVELLPIEGSFNDLRLRNYITDF
jgi:hypothetical protein